MTKSTITRERLIKKAQEQIEFCRHTKITGEGRAHVNQCAALFEIALAAMNGEPVILYRQVNPVNGMKTYWAELDPEEFRHLKQHTDENAEFMTLYRHAQPASVVPDDVLDALQKVARIRLDLNGFDGDRRGIADCLGDAEEALIEVVNRCAAMLAVAPQLPGSEPATVPGKWIPVSERMPEAGGDMIVFTDGIVMSGVSYAKKKGFYIQALEYDDDEPVDSVTHWMPLPAAPQEVKGE